MVRGPRDRACGYDCRRTRGRGSAFHRCRLDDRAADQTREIERTPLDLAISPMLLLSESGLYTGLAAVGHELRAKLVANGVVNLLLCGAIRVVASGLRRRSCGSPARCSPSPHSQCSCSDGCQQIRAHAFPGHHDLLLSERDRRDAYRFVRRVFDGARIAARANALAVIGTVPRALNPLRRGNSERKPLHADRSTQQTNLDP